MPAHLPGGELEYAVLAALWELGTATARDVHERVGTPRGLVYTTTAKVLDRLYEKKLVARVRQGKAFVYKPAVAQDSVDRARVKDAVARVLGTGSGPAMAALVDAVEGIDPTLLDELQRQVAARRRSRDGS